MQFHTPEQENFQIQSINFTGQFTALYEDVNFPKTSVTEAVSRENKE